MSKMRYFVNNLNISERQPRSKKAVKRNNIKFTSNVAKGTKDWILGSMNIERHVHVSQLVVTMKNYRLDYWTRRHKARF